MPGRTISEKTNSERYLASSNAPDSQDSLAGVATVEQSLRHAADLVPRTLDAHVVLEPALGDEVRELR